MQFAVEHVETKTKAGHWALEIQISIFKFAVKRTKGRKSKIDYKRQKVLDLDKEETSSTTTESSLETDDKVI